MRQVLLFAGCAMLMVACNRSEPAPESGDGNAVGEAANEAVEVNSTATLSEGSAYEIRDAAGKIVGGVASLGNDPRGLPLTIQVEGVKAGAHGIHLHEVGRCDGPDFKSAGAHWNPLAKQHGHQNPEGPHAGDLGNLVVDAMGKGRAEVVVAKSDMGDHPNGLAFVIHADTDDEKTDPSGNSGDRIACGIVFPG